MPARTIGIDYCHSYYSSRPLKDRNTCGQAAVAAILDYYGLDPFGLQRTVYDPRDGRYHWRDGEAIDAVRERFPPDCLGGLCGTRPCQIRDALVHGGVEASVRSATDSEQRDRIWEMVRDSVGDGRPVITIMDRTRLSRKPFVAHWAIVHKFSGGTVRIANTRGLETASERDYLEAFKCWFMPREFRNCAIFPAALANTRSS